MSHPADDRDPGSGRLSPLALSARFAFFYGGLFLTIGIYLPYIPLWLEARGFSDEAIGLVLAIPAWLRIVTTPAIALLADRSGRRRLTILVLALATPLCLISLEFAVGLALIVVLHSLAGLLHQPQMPLIEGLAVRAAERHGFAYSRARLWGSLAFVVANLGGGLAIGRFGPDWVLHLATLGALLTAAAAWLLPPEIEPALVRSSGLAGGRPLALLRRADFLLLLLAGLLIQGSHAVYYAYSALDWSRAGLDGTLIGALWALGVLAEVVLFWFGKSLIGRFGPLALLAVGGLAGVVRWPLTALTADPLLLAPLQLLHALSFGAAHLGALTWLGRNVPDAQAGTAQALYATAVGSLGVGSLMFAAGWLYGSFGAGAYFAMALTSLLGTVVALLVMQQTIKRARAAETP
ncbi:MFS transporter [Algihabitans albus]|uniref:MFS transporter n=1 Tax=Algihabitans albus TaxID=2164067 RepID=UPI0013C33BEF|nr:MFS transporter [Algihabitans albus]